MSSAAGFATAGPAQCSRCADTAHLLSREAAGPCLALHGRGTAQSSPAGQCLEFESGCGCWWLSLQTEKAEDPGLEDMRAKHVNGLQPEQSHEGRSTAAGDRQPAVAIPRGGALGFMGAVAQNTLRFKCTTACCYMQGSGMQL